MSTKLGTLTLDLVAKIGSFVGPIKDAEKQAEFSFSNMRKHVNTYGIAVAGAAAGAVTALAAMAVETSNQAVELERFAFRANTTTQEFQKMAVGAQAFGIEGDKLSDMMKDFNEKLGELTAIGAGGGVDFFEKIAVKTEGSAEAAEKLILKMQKLSGPEALQLYVDKLEEAGVPQEQMSFYLESMASDMTDLIPLLVNGGEGMRLYGDMAERAGIIMTDETIESAKMLKDQVYMLDLQLQGAKNQLMQAVIPAFVDIAEAFFSGSEQGVQFGGVADGIADSLRYVAKIAIGAATAVQLVGKVVGGLVATGAAILSGNIGETQAIQDAMVDDLQGTMLAAAAKFDIIDNRAVSSKAVQLRGIREIQEANTKSSSGLKELSDKQNKSTESAKANTKATSENTKAQRELNQAIEQGQRIIYDFGDEQLRISEDLKQDIEDIQAASLKPEAKNKYIQLAKAQSEATKKAYILELESEIYQFNKTEEEKLQDEINIAAHRLDAQRGLNENELKLRKEFLKEKFQAELSYINDEKIARAQSAESNWGGIHSEINGTSDRFGLEQDRFGRYDASQEVFDAQMALAETAEQREAIWQAHHERMQLIESNFRMSSTELQLVYASGMLGTMTDLMGSLLGEQSTGYKAMFAVQKAFAVAEILLNAPKSFSKAFDATIGIPFIGPALAPVAGGLAVAAQLAQVATAKSVNLQGMAHEGIDNIPKEGTWLLDKGERVVDSRTNSDLKNFIKGGSGVTVNVNIPHGYTANQRQDSQGNVTIDVVKQEIAGAFNNIGRANSSESRAIQSAFGLSPAR